MRMQSRTIKDDRGEAFGRLDATQQLGFIHQISDRDRSVKKAIQGYEAFDQAGEEESETVMRSLLKQDSPINLNIALHTSASNGHVKAVCILIGEGAMIDHREARGRTPLHEACAGDHLGVVSFLIKHGADVSARDADLQTTLHNVTHHAQRLAPAIAQKLLDYGADVSLKDLNGAIERYKALKSDPSSRYDSRKRAQALVEVLASHRPKGIVAPIRSGKYASRTIKGPWGLSDLDALKLRMQEAHKYAELLLEMLSTTPASMTCLSDSIEQLFESCESHSSKIQAFCDSGASLGYGYPALQYQLDSLPKILLEVKAE